MTNRNVVGTKHVERSQILNSMEIDKILRIYLTSRHKPICGTIPSIRKLAGKSLGMNEKEEKKIQKVKENFKYILKDFDQPETNEGGERPQYIGYDVPKTLRIEPYIVFIIFVYLKQYRFVGKWEKTAWSFGLEFKGVPLVYNHHKFGFRVSVCNKSGNGKSVAKEALEQIHKAVPLAEKLIEPLILDKLDSGQVSVPNNYKELRERYQFFRKKAKYYFKQIDSNLQDTQLIWMAFHDSFLKATNFSSNA